MKKLLTTLCLITLFSIAAHAKIVIRLAQDGVAGIYTMDDDGTNLILLTDTLRPGAAMWSPNGKKIVFDRQADMKDDSRYHLFWMNSDGTNLQQLTPPHAGLDIHASFSPDGKSILFIRDERRKDENGKGIDSISLLDLETGKIKKVSDHSANDPEFSPNGREIAFTTLPAAGAGGGNVWIMNADGKNARPLLPKHQGDDIFVNRWRPRWSPDGKKILYIEDRNKIQLIDGTIHSIPQGYYCLICNMRGEVIEQLNIPTNLRFTNIAWMEGEKYVLFTAVEVPLRKLPPPGFRRNYNIYKYNMFSKKVTPVLKGESSTAYAEWISDDILPVSPKGKKTTQWANIKTPAP